MEDKCAVIDLGSNTFHLKIVERAHASASFKTIIAKRRYIYLAKGGTSYINEDRFADGVVCMKQFKAICEKHGVNRIHAIGTAMLRSARNGGDFVKTVFLETDVQIEIIDGAREAFLIGKGVTYWIAQHMSSIDYSQLLVMDIGGGSVEYISNPERCEVFISAPIGVSKIRHICTLSEPVQKAEIKTLFAYLDTYILDFIKGLDIGKPKMLIGSSGPFEIFSIMMDQKEKLIFNRNAVLSLADKVLAQDLQGRLDMERMPAERADLSKEAFLLIKFIFEKLPSLESLIHCPFALKEGVIVEQLKLD